MKVKTKKESLIEDVYSWVAGKSKPSPEKEKLLKMMVEATLDYLVLKKHLEFEPNGKN